MYWTWKLHKFINDCDRQGMAWHRKTLDGKGLFSWLVACTDKASQHIVPDVLFYSRWPKSAHWERDVQSFSRCWSLCCVGPKVQHSEMKGELKCSFISGQWQNKKSEASEERESDKRERKKKYIHRHRITCEQETGRRTANYKLIIKGWK